MISESLTMGMVQRACSGHLAQTAGAAGRGRADQPGLRSVTHSQQDSPIPAAAPFDPGLSSKDADLSGLLTASPDEIAARQRIAVLDLAATRQAGAMLRKGGPSTYKRAQRALLADSHDGWDERVEDEAYPATAEGLAEFTWWLVGKLLKTLRNNEMA